MAIALDYADKVEQVYKERKADFLLKKYPNLTEFIEEGLAEEMVAEGTATVWFTKSGEPQNIETFKSTDGDRMNIGEMDILLSCLGFKVSTRQAYNPMTGSHVYWDQYIQVNFK